MRVVTEACAIRHNWWLLMAVASRAGGKYLDVIAAVNRAAEGALQRGGAMDAGGRGGQALHSTDTLSGSRRVPLPGSMPPKVNDPGRVSPAFASRPLAGLPAAARQVPPADLERLFDLLPDVVFFIKDTRCRYVHFNQTLVQRLGRAGRDEVAGRSVMDLYPPQMAPAYLAQDQRVLGGEVIEDLLELQLYPNRQPGWCLTHKRPIVQDGRVVGLMGISRDLGQPDRGHCAFERVRLAFEHMQEHYGSALRVQTLAELAGMSVAQLGRMFKRVFQLTPQQVLIRFRIEAAMRLLQEEASIAKIGQRCGFSDQSAFTRQFKRTVGMPPRDYRTLVLGRRAR